MAITVSDQIIPRNPHRGASHRDFFAAPENDNGAHPADMDFVAGKT
jgi:hypothetical protein